MIVHKDVIASTFNMSRVKMNSCILSGNSFRIDNFSKSIDDLMTLDFYQYSNSVADSYFTGHVFDNILFSSMVQKILAIEHFFKSNSVEELKIEEAEPIIENFALDAACRLGINIDTNSKKKNISLLKYNIKIDEATIYLLIKQLKNKYVKRNLNYQLDFSVVRTPAAKGKILKTDKREMFYEDTIGGGDFYYFFPLSVRRRCLWLANHQAKNDLRDLKDILVDWDFTFSAPYVLNFFSGRLVAAKFYQLLLRELFVLPWSGSFVSGNNLDLYALAEEIEAKKAGIRTVCIPHGIEYGFRFPHCFTGDVFYTYSKNCADYLNALYSEDKFVFDKGLVAGILKAKKHIENSNPKIIYFSEPREPEVNLKIIRGLLNKLHNEKLYIKHHPKDTLSDYDEFKEKIYVIDDIESAIQGNVCLSRKSTTLLEGVYNGSKCGAIIINEKDKAIFYNFPSLQDERINVFNSIEEAAEWALNTIRAW